MDYFSQLGDEANISSKYESQLNELNGQKNQVADTMANMKNTYEDELYNYGMGKAEDLQKLIESGVDAGGLAALKVAAIAYRASGAKDLVGQGIQKIKDYYDGYADITPPTVAEAPRIADDAIPLETFKEATETPPEAEAPAELPTEPSAVASETSPIAESATGELDDGSRGVLSADDVNAITDPATDITSGTVGGVTEATEQAVASQNAGVAGYNAEIQSQVDAGELTANTGSVAGTVTDTVAEANALADSPGSMTSTELGSEDALSAIQATRSAATSDVASGLSTLAETETAENTLDFSGVGEALAVGSLVGAGIKEFVDWIHPTPPPPPPVAPAFKPYVQAPTFISSQVQSGI